MDSYLKHLYTDTNSPVAFSSPLRIFNEAKKRYPKLKFATVKSFLAQQPSYTLHKPVTKKFKRAPVITNGLGEQVDVDLADTTRLSGSNDRIKFLIVMLDPFSRYAMVEPIKNKKSQTVLEGMKRLFSKNPTRVPKALRHDEGGEFVNKNMRAYLKQKNIAQYIAKGQPKANYAERFIRTIKNKIYRFMTHNKTKRYIDVLPNLVESYNNSTHSSIGMRPTSVTEGEVENKLWKKLYLSGNANKIKLKRHRYKKGQQVRVVVNKKPFEKGFTPNWSETVYLVDKKLYRDNIPVYKVSDLKHYPQRKTYYEQELQPVSVVTKPPKIEKVIQTKRNNKGETLYHIRWLHFGPKYDEWVTRDDLNKHK